MKFQPGDKVKFLNEKGGGIVSRIIDSATVEVAIEEGFDVPVKITDLIKVASENASEKLFDVEFNVHAPVAEVPRQEQARTPSENKMFVARDRQEGIYLVLKPHDQKMLISGYVDIIIVNHTSYDVLYNVFQKVRGGYEGADYGSIGPREITMIDSCSRQDMEAWLEGIVQLMFHTGPCNEVMKPLEIPYKIKAAKLVSEDQYIKTSFTEGRVFAMQLYQWPVDEEKSVRKPVQLKPSADKTLIEKHRVDDGFAEVDLHIQSLVDDLKGLDPQQMINIQLDYLKRAIESAIAANYQRVIFIHGVGAGILKIEIRKLLDAYEFLEYFDASIARYGIGATEVLIHKKK